MMAYSKERRREVLAACEAGEGRARLRYDSTAVNLGDGV